MVGITVTIAIPIYRSLHTPEPRNPQKVSKSRSRASRPGVSKKCQRTDFGVFLIHFRVIWDFFDTFLTLLAWRPGNAFLRLFGGFRAQRASGLLYMAAGHATLQMQKQAMENLLFQHESE